MTNYLAVATVTAALKNIIQAGIKDDLPGTVVTTVTPETLNNAQKERKINIYLYQISPNKELQQESSLPRYYNGRTKEKSVQLDLYYLITFYGNELELEPQQLLGSTIRTLLDHSLLKQELIEQTIISSDFLANSTLNHQIKKVSFTLNSMTPDELTRIWSTLFRSPYSLSIPYVCKAVLIEGEKTGSVAPPVRSIVANPIKDFPIIEAIEASTGKNKPITLDSSLRIYGRQLRSPNTRVGIGNILITPQVMQETKVELNLSSLDSSERKQLRAGIQSLQIIHLEKTVSVIDPVKSVESNALPVILCPNIAEEVKISKLRETWNNLYSSEVTVKVNLMVDPHQRVLLLINQITNDNPEAYIFPARLRKQATETVKFFVRDIKAGKYLVRVQIDGAASSLEIDPDPNSRTYQQYYKPVLAINSEMLEGMVQV